MYDNISSVNIFEEVPKRGRNKKGARRTLGLFTSFSRKIFSNKLLVKKIFFTLGIVTIIRALASIPLPGVDPIVIEEVFKNGSSIQNQYLFTLFTGGRLDSPSIIGLGIAAYINASIIMQLLPYVINKLKELQREGERGRQIINQITRLITFPLSFIYGFTYLILISQTDLGGGGGLPSGSYLIPHAAGSNMPEIGLILFMAFVLAVGTVILMWLGEFITENGIGNGASIIILIGIISNLPGYIINDFSTSGLDVIFQQLLKGDFTIVTMNLSFWILPVVLIGLILTIALIIFVNESQKEITIQYARRVKESDRSSSSSVLPIKFTVTGVMPVIFAFSFISMPQLVIPILQSFEGFKSSQFLSSIQSSFLFSGVGDAAKILDGSDLLYEIVLFFLIILFGMFYAFIVLNPRDTAENLQKNGGFIPGIRPGSATEAYLSKVLLRIGFVGSVFLGFVTLLPFIARYIISVIGSGQQSNLNLLTGIGGTSLLILVSVFLDIKRQYNSLKVSAKYSEFV
ncbi:preprotein translocase subunit SecY [Candidatus Dojkabacteria bacterium]|uniref:Protein translocase subunit SecY n=1 Tax=Candidatus Dojkabacteria bacterium TaxID=2099670 RepID=A0A3M0Z341_9BACT|nr:MAG: preprotein translocase subunit SecY [Candidatus Dojkabacteria bacterium]